MQQMQENGRGAFETIERLVFAVSSVAAMLESSYDALHSSFMAVVSVADHMDQLKEQLVSVFKSIVRLRFLKRIIVKILRLLHLPVPSFLVRSQSSPPHTHTLAKSRAQYSFLGVRACSRFRVCMTVYVSGKGKEVMDTKRSSSLASRHYQSACALPLHQLPSSSFFLWGWVFACIHQVEADLPLSSAMQQAGRSCVSYEWGEGLCACVCLCLCVWEVAGNGCFGTEEELRGGRQ